MNVTGPLLCIGLTTLDVVAVPVRAESFEGVRLIDAIRMAPAGTAAGAALVAATLGVATQLAGAVGEDAMGRFVRAELAHAGVDVSLLKTLPGRVTSATLIPVDEPLRRRVFHAPGASPYMQAGSALAEAARRARAVHYAGVGAPQLDAAAPACLPPPGLRAPTSPATSYRQVRRPLSRSAASCRMSMSSCRAPSRPGC